MPSNEKRKTSSPKKATPKKRRTSYNKVKKVVAVVPEIKTQPEDVVAEKYPENVATESSQKIVEFPVEVNSPVLFDYRKIKHGSSRYPIHIFRKGDRKHPLCGPTYGIFENKVLPLPSVDQFKKEVCWNCKWEMENTKLI